MGGDRPPSGGIGLAGLLTVLFVGLKLTHYIDWSWWWVLAPLWLPGVTLIVVGLVIFMIGLMVEDHSNRKIAKKRAALIDREGLR